MRSSLSRHQERKDRIVFSVGDGTMQAIEYALDALAMRAEVTAQNVSNAEVPGFRATRVGFEEQLRNAIERGSIERAAGPSLRKSSNPADIQGNNVELEDEVIEMLKTNLMQGAMVEAFNFKTTMLRSAIRGQ